MLFPRPDGQAVCSIDENGNANFLDSFHTMWTEEAQVDLEIQMNHSYIILPARMTAGRLKMWNETPD